MGRFDHETYRDRLFHHINRWSAAPFAPWFPKEGKGKNQVTIQLMPPAALPGAKLLKSLTNRS